jgi:preprotein translocase subunit SecE
MHEIHPTAYRYALSIYALFAGYFWYVFRSAGLFLATHFIPQSPSGFSVVNPNFAWWNAIQASLLTLVVVVGMFASQKLKNYVVDVGDELTRVSWPSLKETQKATGVVLALVVVSAALLFCIDFAFVKLINLILSTAT